MLVHNKYLEELGITKDTYPLGKSCNHENELDEDMGVVVCQTWNLDRTLAMELYSYLRAFKDIKPGHPVCTTKEEWDDILDEMIDGFADYIKRKDEIDLNAEHPKLDKSLDLLKKWWEALWW